MVLQRHNSVKRCRVRSPVARRVSFHFPLNPPRVSSSRHDFAYNRLSSHIPLPGLPTPFARFSNRLLFPSRRASDVREFFPFPLLSKRFRPAARSRSRLIIPPRFPIVPKLPHRHSHHISDNEFTVLGFFNSTTMNEKAY